MAGGVKPLPRTFKALADNLYEWRINTGVHDWVYPYSVDLNLYRKSDIIFDYKSISYHSPNSLEGRWAREEVKYTSYGIVL